MAYKFKVGDRVRYIIKDVGNVDLQGWEGVVMGIDDTAAPYTVRFDHDLCTLVTDERFWKPGQPRNRDFWCKEENLELADEQYIKKKGVNVSNRWKPNMTAEEIKIVREMLEAGASYADIGERLHLPVSTLKNRLCALRRMDPTFPRSTYRGKKETSEDGEGDEDAEEMVEDDPLEGDVEPDYKALLEAAMEDIAKMDREIAELREVLEASALEYDRICRTSERLSSENAEMRAQIDEHELEVAELNARLHREQERATSMEADKHIFREMAMTLFRKYVDG